MSCLLLSSFHYECFRTNFIGFWTHCYGRLCVVIQFSSSYKSITDAELVSKILNPKDNTTLSFFGIDTQVINILPARILATVLVEDQGDLARSRFEDNEELRFVGAFCTVFSYLGVHLTHPLKASDSEHVH